MCLCMHMPVAGPTCSMGVNFISQETWTILYCGDEFPRIVECSVCYRYCSGCSWQRCHGGHLLCQDPRAPAPLWGIWPCCTYHDKAACLLLGQAQTRCPVAAGHQQGWGFPRVAQTPAVAFVLGHLREMNVFWPVLVL